MKNDTFGDAVDFTVKCPQYPAVPIFIQQLTCLPYVYLNLIAKFFLLFARKLKAKFADSRAV